MFHFSQPLSHIPHIAANFPILGRFQRRSFDVSSLKRKIIISESGPSVILVIVGRNWSLIFERLNKILSLLHSLTDFYNLFSHSCLINPCFPLWKLSLETEVWHYNQRKPREPSSYPHRDNQAWNGAVKQPSGPAGNKAWAQPP